MQKFRKEYHFIIFLMVCAAVYLLGYSEGFWRGRQFVSNLDAETSKFQQQMQPCAYATLHGLDKPEGCK